MPSAHEDAGRETQWRCPTDSDEAATALAAATGISPLLAGLLARRGLTNAGVVEAFLRPSLASLEDPFLLAGVEDAARLLDKAVIGGQSILVFGDYDVDGVTSTTLLVSLLREFGAQPRFIVPRRLDEGYGLTRIALERALADGIPDVFVALDCGTNAVAEIAWLKERGCKVIVVDHHSGASGGLPDCIMVNPRARGQDAAPWSQLCTAGLVFKLAHGFLKLRRASGDARALTLKLADSLDLVAMGTIADLVPLHAENRILARHGLRMLEKCARPGLRALFAVSGLQAGQSLVSADISYRLGPRINASGRLADAALPVELLLGGDSSLCAEAAATLESLNRERQGIERLVAAEAEIMVEQTQRDAPALVVFSETWHPGVVGIVAGKLCRRFGRPCIVLGREGALAKGSGRSVPGISLVEVLESCAPMLKAWGGHPMAVGVSLDASRVDDFREAFAKAVDARLVQGAPLSNGHRVSIDAWVDAAQLGEETLRELDMLHPYGESNPEPILGVRQARLSKAEIFGTDNYRCKVSTGAGRNVSAIAWRKAAHVPPPGSPLDLAVKFQWNFWNGRQYPQLEILDWRVAE